jgi:hypothetical protein
MSVPPRCGGLVAGDWWLVVGGWWLVAGGWWLVAGGWWLVTGRGGGWGVGTVDERGHFFENLGRDESRWRKRGSFVFAGAFFLFFLNGDGAGGKTRYGSRLAGARGETGRRELQVIEAWGEGNLGERLLRYYRSAEGCCKLGWIGLSGSVSSLWGYPRGW